MQVSEEGQLLADEQSIPDGGLQAWATVMGGYALCLLMYNDQYKQPSFGFSGGLSNFVHSGLSFCCHLYTD
jgi:hypothetical protein